MQVDAMYNYTIHLEYTGGQKLFIGAVVNHGGNYKVPLPQLPDFKLLYKTLFFSEP